MTAHPFSHPFQTMLKRTILASTLCAFTLGGGSAFAASFDFRALADTPAPAGPGESAWTTLSITASLITLTATARSLDNASNYFVYLDSGNAGMGVCKMLQPGAPVNVGGGSTSNICNVASDDNLTKDEVLTWDFSEIVELKLDVVNGAHNTNFMGNFGVYVGAGNPTQVSDFTQLLLSPSVSSPILTGSRFSFISGATITGIETNNQQLYLSATTANSTVPEPSTMLLFGTGLAGLAAWRYRKGVNA